MKCDSKKKKEKKMYDMVRCAVTESLNYTEVQRVSFVGSTNEDYHPDPLCNLQNLHAVPP